MLKLRYALALLLLNAGVCAAAETAPVPAQATLTKALHEYLAVNGDLCLGKFNWPIDVSEEDFLTGTWDARQMPVLEKLNLVAAAPGKVMRKVDDVDQVVQVNQYSLTAIGRIYFIPRHSQMAAPNGDAVEHDHDFCAGKVSLDKLVRWDKLSKTDAGWETTLYYTFKFAPVWWADKPETKEVFPIFSILQKGQGTLQLQQRFKLVGKNWVPITLI